MSRAIVTRYVPAGNRTGARYKALGAKRNETYPEISLTLRNDDGVHYEINHCRVARELARKMQWAGLYVAGDMPESDGSQVFVCVMPGHLADHKRMCTLLAVDLEQHGKREGRDFFMLLDARTTR